MIPLQDVQLDATQKTLATRALLRVAQVDDASTAEELLLIRGFYEDGSEITPFATLLADAKQPAALSASAFPEAGQRDLVVASCLMVAHADGHYSAAERTVTQTIASEIGMPVARHDELVALVQDYLLAQLAPLPDSGSVVKVGEEMRG